jgi:hypothetical protein
MLTYAHTPACKGEWHMGQDKMAHANAHAIHASNSTPWQATSIPPSVACKKAWLPARNMPLFSA